ncbi:MAG: glycosyltransferase family 2 protein [Phycisphaeraceae bacterium]
MISVVVPAHNESDVIGRCLGAILSDADIGELDVVVVCNACTDDTAEIARRFGPDVRVLETDVPGKPNALNMGDRVAQHFPRIYVDADVVMATEAVRQVAEALGDEQVLAAAPRPRINLQGRNWLIRSYYRIWTNLPYCREEMVGSGVYALSEAGREAFGDFPELLAEDDFIRLTYPKERRKQVSEASFQIDAPTSFWALVKIRCRWARSNDQIDATYPHLRSNDKRDYNGPLRELVGQPGAWPAMFVYAFVVVTARLVGKWQIRFAANPWNWSRDATAREAAVGTEAAYERTERETVKTRV